MKKIKISAVSYTNSKAFTLGIEQSEVINEIELSLDIPSDCAYKLINNEVDMGLVPVATIPLIPNAKIVGDYCIGSIGAVNSVFILSDLPIEQVKTVKLDSHSRTSNKLAAVLFKFHFKKDVRFVEDAHEQTDAIVLIGDRTFSRKNDFKFAYDMGEEWMKLTGLPFVYAAWVSNKEIDGLFIDKFNQALAEGLTQRQTLLKDLPEVPNFDMEDYLMNKLSFEFDDQKRKALNLFLKYIEQL